MRWWLSCSPAAGAKKILQTPPCDSLTSLRQTKTKYCIKVKVKDNNERESKGNYESESKNILQTPPCDNLTSPRQPKTKYSSKQPQMSNKQCEIIVLYFCAKDKSLSEVSGSKSQLHSFTAFTFSPEKPSHPIPAKPSLPILPIYDIQAVLSQQIPPFIFQPYNGHKN